jgi:5-methylcytosine-specific restriction endonuclease McrA
MLLTIELVPKSSWYSNVRSNVTINEWDIIRKKSYKKAGYKCEICGGKGNKHPVECHEIWDYNESTNVQKLIGLISLCPKCHKTKHVGLSQIRGEEDIVIKQLMKVNKISDQESIEYINESFNIWIERSDKKWTLDISYLDEYLDK